MHKCKIYCVWDLIPYFHFNYAFYSVPHKENPQLFVCLGLGSKEPLHLSAPWAFKNTDSSNYQTFP